jgi:hypothetical protein
MLRKNASPTAIQARINGLIHQNREVKEDGSRISVSLPTPLRQPDSDGCNWTYIGAFGGGTGYQSACLAALNQVVRTEFRRLVGSIFCVSRGADDSLRNRRG